MGLISKAFSDIITFSRSSNATRVGPDGKVQYAPHNLMLRSQELDNAAWTKDNCTATANAIAAPDGTVTADMITDGASGSPSLYLTASVTIAASVPHTASGYVKRGNTDWIRFIVQDGSFGNQTAVWFNLATGATTSGGTLTSVGNGWYRFSVTATIGSATTAEYQINTAAASSSNTRVSGGTYYLWGAQLSQGSIAGDYTPTTSAAVYGPRFDYDPVTLAAKGLLIEEQRTNLLTYSEDFTNGAAYISGRATISANTAAAPDGNTTADSLTQSGSTTSGYVAGYSTNSGTNTYTFSVFVKPNGKNFVRLTEALSGSDRSTYFNLSSGTVGTKDAAHTAAISAYTNGWYRVSISYSGSAASYYPGVYLADTDNSTTVVASGGVYVWGTQLELGAFATSYIPTVASTVTRSADVASVNTLSPWFNATEGTIYAEAEPFSLTAGTVAYAISDGTTSNYMASWTQVNEHFLVVSGGSTQASLDGGTYVVNQYTKTAGAYKANDFALSLNGGAVVTDSSGSIPTVSVLGIGNRNSANYLNGHIKRLAYYPRRLTNAELQSLTS